MERNLLSKYLDNIVRTTDLKAKKADTQNDIFIKNMSTNKKKTKVFPFGRSLRGEAWKGNQVISKGGHI